jgi:hypothetical protein
VAIVDRRGIALVIASGVGAMLAALLLVALIAGQRLDAQSPGWRPPASGGWRTFVRAFSRPAIVMAPAEDEIRAAAFAIWEKTGEPDAVAVWLRAEAALRRPGS